MCTACDLRKIFKVTVAVFDYSLLVIDQGGNVLIGKAPEEQPGLSPLGHLALGLRLGPILSQEDALGWEQEASTCPSWEVRLQMLARSSVTVPNP